MERGDEGNDVDDFTRTLCWMRNEGNLCDCILTTEDGGQIAIHKCILATCSRYFHVLFTWPREPQNRSQILIPDISINTLSLIVDYAYTRVTRIEASNAVSLITKANEFSILGMVKDCCRFLLRNLNPANCLGLLKFARAYFFTELEAAAYRYLLLHFDDVLEISQEYLDLTLEEVCSILNADDLNVWPEEKVWGSCLRWINHDPETRHQYTAYLLKCVRIGLLEQLFIDKNVRNHPYVVSNDACRFLLDEPAGLREVEEHNYCVPKDVMEDLFMWSPPRIPWELMFVIGGWSLDGPVEDIEVYDTRADKWNKVEAVDPDGPRAYHKCVVHNYEIYVIGGTDGFQCLNTCRSFNTLTLAWTEKPPMHYKRCYVSAVRDGDLIYSLGGFDGFDRLNSAESFVQSLNQWTLIPSMIYCRSDAGAAVLDHLVYVAGGFSGEHYLDTVEFYDSNSDQWTTIFPMESRRSGVSCISFHGLLYAIGGFDGEKRMNTGEKFDPNTGMWSPIQTMYTTRSNYAIEVIDDLIFVVGGYDGFGTINEVECYDYKYNRWMTARGMSLPRSALSACTIFNLPNVKDYINR